MLTNGPGKGIKGQGVMESAIPERSGNPISPRLRVVITCVTFETVKVVKPIKYFKGERVYVIHTAKKTAGGTTNVYAEFYEEVVRQLKEYGLKDEDIIEKNIQVFRYKEVLSELISIMTKEIANGNIVYINTSAGSMEFAAAATLSSMMFRGVLPFTVHTRKYTISGEDNIRKAFFIDDKPMGQSEEVADPDILPTYPLDMPPKDLVVALRILRKRKEAKISTKYSVMITELKSANAWTYSPEKEQKMRDKDANKGDKLKQAEKMYYSRHYIDGWIDNGWVDGKEGRGKELKITEAGKNVTEIFYKEY